MALEAWPSPARTLRTSASVVCGSSATGVSAALTRSTWASAFTRSAAESSSGRWKAWFSLWCGAPSTMPGSWYGLAPSVRVGESVVSTEDVGVVVIAGTVAAGAGAAAAAAPSRARSFPQPARAGARTSTVAPARTAAVCLAEVMGRIWATP